LCRKIDAILLAILIFSGWKINHLTEFNRQADESIAPIWVRPSAKAAQDALKSGGVGGSQHAARPRGQVPEAVMDEIISAFAYHYDYLLLLFLRVSGLILPSPIFGRRNLPNRVKIVILCDTDYLVHGGTPVTGTLAYETLPEYVLLSIKELMFGLRSVCQTIFFNLVYSAGQMIDMQIGFGIVSVYDIQNSSQVPVIGNLLNILLLIVFFSVNGHLKLVSILYATVEKVPVGHVQLSPDLVLAILEAFSLSFVLAVMVAMPIIASGMILEVVMGVLIRSVPQMNMFVVGIPLKLPSAWSC
jgi:flagellar biosynthetic protein FliR